MNCCSQRIQANRFAIIVSSLIFTCACPIRLFSQIATIDDTTQTPRPGTAHNYIGDANVIVNPANGSVSIRIAAPTPKERGSLKIPTYAYTYDTAGIYSLQPGFLFIQDALGNVDAQPAMTSLAMGTSINPERPGTITMVDVDLQTNGGIGPGAGAGDCVAETDYVYIDLAGGRHPLGLSWVPPSYQGICAKMGIINTLVGGDLEYKARIPSTASYSGVYLTDKHGNSIGLDTNGNSPNGSGRVYAIGASPLAPNYAPATLSVPGLGGSYQSTPYYTPSGNSFDLQVVPVPLNATWPEVAGSRAACASIPNNTLTTPTLMVGNQTSGIQSLTLPNGQRYLFEYNDPYGYISKITYPTGAWESFDWQINSSSEGVTYEDKNAAKSSDPCSYRYDWIALKTRTISFDGSNPASQESYSYTTTWPSNSNSIYWTSKTTTVVTTDLIAASHPSHTTIYSYTPGYEYSSPISSSNNVANSGTPVENSISYYGGNGALLRQDIKTWNPSTLDQLQAECTVDAAGQMKGDFFKYLPFTFTGSGITSGPVFPEGNLTDVITDKAEYDYGLTSCIQPSSTPTRETVHTYATFGATPQNAVDATILDRPLTVKTYGSGILLSETDYTYDGSATQPVSPTAIGHDEADYAPNSTNPRGNATQIVHRCFSSSCQDLISNVVYDETGQVVSVADRMGNKTTLSYTDAYTSDDGSPPGNTNTYITTMIKPATSGVIHNESFVWDYLNGELRTSADEDQQITSYTYADVWARPTKAQTPDGGITSITYNDSGPNPSVVTSVTESASQTVVNDVIADAFMHPIERDLTSDPAGVDITRSAYDGLGRVASVTNPYRSTRDPSYGATQTTYDALNRAVKTVHPDGSFEQWCYDGVASDGQTNCRPNLGVDKNTSWIDYSDETGLSWQRGYDGLGRLMQVVEPGGLETDYRYDGLNDLLSVNQRGVGGETARARSFTYDSLSELVTATNPETGTISYSYVNNNRAPCAGGPSLPCSKTDARGVTTSYTYDALNRLTGKTYSDGNTPASCYEYDLALGKDTGYNQVGRLVSEWTQPGACPLSSNAIPGTAINWKYITSYDPMGRILSEQQCPLAPCAAPTPISYSYDLAGGLTSSTNGMPSSSIPIALTYAPDASGRLAKLTSSWSDATHPQTLFEADTSTASALGAPAAYSPFGGLEAALYGISSTTNVVGLSDVRSYDNRARLVTKSVLGTPALIPSTVDLTMNTTTFTTAEDPGVSMHVSCNSACGKVSLSVDGHDWIPAYDVDGNGNITGWYNVWFWPSPYLTPGTHTLTANYLGNSTYAPSSKSVTVTINPIGTQQTSLTLSIAPTAFTTGEEAVASVHVGCNAACGQVEFDIDGNRWVVWSVDANGDTSADTYYWQNSSFTVGNHTLTATYLGNSTYAPVSQSVSFTVQPTGTQQTSMTLSFDPSTFTTVDEAVASVHVGCNAACGLVQFVVDGTRWVTWNLDSSGNTSADSYWWQDSSFTIGNHTLTANYLGNATYAPVSQSVPFTVVPIGTQPISVSLSASPGTTFSASSEFDFPTQVGCNSACGFVRLIVDGNPWALFKLDDTGGGAVDSRWVGNAPFTPGTHTVRAHYYGNATYAPSDSSDLTVTVTP